LTLICVGFLITAFVGCSEQKPDGLPTLYPVALKFTQDGKPCEGASVTLIAETPGTQTNWIVGGSTDATGTAVLKTYGKYPGVPEGKYKVVVSKVVREQIGTPSESMYESQGENAYYLIDPAYSKPGMTTLEIEVTPNKKVYEPFELGKEIREKVKAPGER